MASEPQGDSTERQRLPFEPLKNRKKSPVEATGDRPKAANAQKSTPEKSPPAKNAAQKSAKQRSSSKGAAKSGATSSNSAKQSNSRDETSLPAVVSQRMARRMAIFCGIPTTLGMTVFIVSYWVVSQGWYKLPNIAVVFMSLGGFGLGFLGLSYGVLSASWEESEPGSKLGWSEFTTNLGRMTEAWRAARQQKSS
ncbi:MAG: PAM68 family protein [Leptolyngbyaceae bacterium]|nr:PAM68 family protein [Leptolyngbyaceae bacterium]